MLTMNRKVNGWETKMDYHAKRFAYHHPAMAFAAVIVLAPMIMLFAVFTLTFLLSLPINLLF